MISLEDQILLRERRHKKLMAMIQEYHLTDQQVEHLERVKKNTELEIDHRFLKSKWNQNYVFPLILDNKSEENQQYPRKMTFQHTFYDLRAQNYLANPTISAIQQQNTVTARRVKSLGPQKLDPQIQIDIKKKLRERPQQRQGSRSKIMLPSINVQVKSQRILSKVSNKFSSARQSPHKLRSSKIDKLTEKKQLIIRQISLKKQQKVGQLIGVKLLTEGNNALNFGHSKIVLNHLNVYSSERKQLKPMKLLTQ